MCRMAPSILAADFNRLGEQIKSLEDNGIEVLHIDVMDGSFVPSISFGMPVISSIRRESRLFFDIHLMIDDPVRYIRDFADAGADSITFHVEACEDPGEVISEIRDCGLKTAISLNPGTPLSDILPYLELVDMVLVMSVEPGFGGQRLKGDMIERLRELDRLRKEKKYDYLLEIDGGVNLKNIGKIAVAGADLIVAGTAVFAGDIRENLVMLKEGIESAS